MNWSKFDINSEALDNYVKSKLFFLWYFEIADYNRQFRNIKEKSVLIIQQ